MSRNFELMTQLEHEAGVPDRHRAGMTNCAGSAEDFPLPAILAGDSGGEEMLRLIQGIFLSAKANTPRQVVLCGVDDDNGSSLVCARAGLTLAANSSRAVCLIDGNVRSRRLSRFFGVDCAASFFSPHSSLLQQCVKIGSGLWLAGPRILAENGRVLLPLYQLKERLAQLRDEFEYVLIDAPGTSVSGDAHLLGVAADAAILVIKANTTRRLTARKAKETFEASGIRVLGSVLYNRSFPVPAGLYKRL